MADETKDRKHYTMVFTGGGSARLGADIMRLRYDKLVLVLEGMAAEAEKQQLADDARGRRQLALLLRRVRDGLRPVVEDARAVARLCEPYNAKEAKKARAKKAGN